MLGCCQHLFLFLSRPSNPWWSSSSSSWSSCFAVQYHSTAVRESKPIATSSDSQLSSRVWSSFDSEAYHSRESLSLLSLSLSLSSNARSRFNLESPIETLCLLRTFAKREGKKRERERERARAQKQRKERGEEKRKKSVSRVSLSQSNERVFFVSSRYVVVCVLFYTCVA